MNGEVCCEFLKPWTDLSSVQRTGQVGIKSSFHVNDNPKLFLKKSF